MKLQIIKKWLFLPITIIMICLLVLPTKANGWHVDDDANLFKVSERYDLESVIDDYFEDTDLDVAIVTTNDTGSKSSRRYADDYYDTNDIGKGDKASGVLLLMDMDNREIYISTHGLGISYFTDERIEDILDDMMSYMAKENYYQAALCFLNSANFYIASGIPKGQHTVSETSVVTEILLSAAAAIVVGLSFYGISLKVVQSRYRKKTPSDNFAATNKVKYEKELATLVDSRTSSRYIPRPKPTTTSSSSRSSSSSTRSSSNRSTTHRSSSGRTHGGGGRKF